MPIRVMPIWTVERNLPGSEARSSAVWAPLATGLGHRPQTRLARRDDRELRHCEHAVQRHQQQDDDDVEPWERFGGGMAARRLAAILALAHNIFVARRALKNSLSIAAASASPMPG